MMAGISCWCIAVRMDSSWLMGSPANFWKRGCAGPRNARSGRSWRQWRGANGGEGVAGRRLRWTQPKNRSCKGWKTVAVLLVTCVSRPGWSLLHLANAKCYRFVLCLGSGKPYKFESSDLFSRFIRKGNIKIGVIPSFKNEDQKITLLGCKDKITLVHERPD